MRPGRIGNLDDEHGKDFLCNLFLFPCVLGEFFSTERQYFMAGKWPDCVS